MEKSEANSSNARPAKSAAKWLVGVDEVGRGPLAGPVTVCAVAIPFLGSAEASYAAARDALTGMAGGREYPVGVDSKKMKEADREFWHGHITALAESCGACESPGSERDSLIVSLEHAAVADIDAKGIAVCIRELVDENLRKILEKIQAKVSSPANAAADSPIEIHVLLDGALSARFPSASQKTIIKGDEKEMVISLASVFAKVTRDQHMKELSKDPKYTAYGFEVHKGYGTAKHRQAMGLHGLSDQHRKSFCKNFGA